MEADFQVTSSPALHHAPAMDERIWGPLPTFAVVENLHDPWFTVTIPFRMVSYCVDRNSNIADCDGLLPTFAVVENLHDPWFAFNSKWSAYKIYRNTQ